MNIELVIAQLRSRCSILSERVAGAAQFAAVTESTSLQMPCAYVIPLDDSPDPSMSQTGVRQRLSEAFEVVVALDNRADERGQAAGVNVHTMRAALWRALLGWQPEERYDAITYEGGNVLSIDRARLFWRFEFATAMEIEPSDGFQEVALGELPAFHGANLRFEVADPGAGQITHDVPVPRTGNLP